MCSVSLVKDDLGSYSQNKMAQTSSILLSFVGNRDPYVEESDQYGPVLSLLEARQFGRVILFCTGPEYVERARSVESIARRDLEFDRFRFADIELASPIDYEEIYEELAARVEDIKAREAHRNVEFSVLLDPGTPQMQTAWFLLVRSGALEATLLQGVPPRFAAGSYRVKEVDFRDTRLPSVTLPEPTRGEGPEAVSLREKAPAGAKAGAGETAGPWVSRKAGRVVAVSPAIQRVLEEAENVAKYDVSVLLEGETGTGKNVIARQIHDLSPRRQETFASVNCSAITVTLAESMLFGQKKGAYTDAKTDRLGAFRAADGGTLFLDEVGDLPLEIQPKLLRVLEDGSMTPLGEDTEYTVDVRVIAATNHDISAMVEAGSFRHDLYQRLRQSQITVPPLRERKEDVLPLVELFVDDWNRKYHEDKRFSEDALQMLAEYSWPGNVREVSNVVRDCFARARGTEVGVDLLPPGVRRVASGGEPEAGGGGEAASVGIPPEGVNIREILGQLERDYYLEAMRLAEGNRERAAQLLGVTGAAFRKAWRERIPH